MARPAKRPAAKKPKPAPKKAAVRAKPHQAPPSRVGARKTAAAPVSAKAQATPTKVVKPGMLSEKELEQVVIELEQQRETLTRELADLQAGSLDVSQSELSGEASFDEEYADAGTFTFERERDLSLGNNIRDLLGKVNHALRRVEEGVYGTCERCGQPIDKARLRALPYTTMCITCKQREEGLS